MTRKKSSPHFLARFPTGFAVLPTVLPLIAGLAGCASVNPNLPEKEGPTVNFNRGFQKFDTSDEKSAALAAPSPISPRSPAQLDTPAAPPSVAAPALPQKISPPPAVSAAGPVAPTEPPLEKLIVNLNSRIDSIESKLSSLNDKMDVTRGGVEEIKVRQTTLLAPEVMAPAAEGFGKKVEPKLAHSDPDHGYVQNEATDLYRQALILAEAGKHPEAVLAWSEFLKKYPDHTLAGTAQYHVGESYLKQREYKLAVQEFNRVLDSYPSDPSVPDTLLQIAVAEDLLKKGEDSAEHRQLLTSLFPESPAAALIPRYFRPETQTVQAEPTIPSTATPASVSTSASASVSGTKDKSDLDNLDETDSGKKDLKPVVVELEEPTENELPKPTSPPELKETHVKEEGEDSKVNIPQTANLEGTVLPEGEPQNPAGALKH